jgi:PadR family transcriptional regulator PadR
MEAQLKKGILEMCVLFTLKGQEMHGYDVMKSMKQYFPEVNESTFYAILRRLHGDGSAETFMGEASNGPMRKYYRITPKGLETLGHNIESWNRICSLIEKMGITSYPIS